MNKIKTIVDGVSMYKFENKLSTIEIFMRCRAIKIDKRENETCTDTRHTNKTGIISTDSNQEHHRLCRLGQHHKRERERENSRKVPFNLHSPTHDETKVNKL